MDNFVNLNEPVFFPYIIANNICLTHITSSILIYVYTIGYILSIEIKFIIRQYDTKLQSFYSAIYEKRVLKFNFLNILKSQKAAYCLT